MPRLYATSEPAPEPRPGPTGTPLLLGPVDEIGDDQEVAGVAHLYDRLDLEVEPRSVFGALGVALAATREQRGETAFESRCRFIVQMLLDRHAGRRREIGQIILAQRNGEVAALRDRDGVGQVPQADPRSAAPSPPGVVKILLRREQPRPPRIGQHMAFGDAHARFVRAKFLARDELHRMRRYDRQVEFGGQLARWPTVSARSSLWPARCTSR